MRLTPTVPIRFRFDGSRAPALDRAWIEVLVRSAERPRGLVVIDVGEPLPQGRTISASESSGSGCSGLLRTRCRLSAGDSPNALR